MADAQEAMTSLERVGPSTESNRSAFGPLLQVLALLAAVLATLHAIAPLVDLVRGWNDFAFIYAAGRTWLRSGSPYNVSLWREQWTDIYPSFAGLTAATTTAPTQPYIYPPHWVVAALPLSLLKWPLACRIWDSVNLLACIGTVLACVALLPEDRRPSWRTPTLWFCLAVAASNGAVRWALWECQMSLVPTLGVVAAYWAWNRGSRTWVTACTWVALLKPQVGLLAVFYLALNGPLVEVLGGAVLALAVGSLSLIRVDLGLLPTQIRECVRLHLSISYNAYDYFYSLSALFARFRAWSFLSPLVGFTSLAGLAIYQRLKRISSPPHRIPALAQLSLACAFTVAFVPLHGYDLVLLTPLVFWACCLRPIWIPASIFTLVLCASRCQFWGSRFGIYPTAPWVTLALAVVVAAGWLASTREVRAVPALVSS